MTDWLCFLPMFILKQVIAATQGRNIHFLWTRTRNPLHPGPCTPEATPPPPPPPALSVKWFTELSGLVLFLCLLPVSAWKFIRFPARRFGGGGLAVRSSGADAPEASRGEREVVVRGWWERGEGGGRVSNSAQTIATVYTVYMYVYVSTICIDRYRSCHNYMPVLQCEVFVCLATTLSLI